MVNVAVVGFGMSATVFHLPFLSTLPGFRVAAIVQRRGHEAAAAFPEAIIYTQFDDVLSNPDIHLVVVTTPNSTHFPFAKAALLAGKHVVVEKPFTNTSAEAAELVALAQQKGLVLSVYHNRRYVSDFFTIKALIAQGVLGAVHEYECHFDRYRPEPRNYAHWREESSDIGGGVLYDLGSHLIDQALCLFGLPQNITAHLKIQRPFGLADDYFDLRLDFDGTTAILKSSMLVLEMGPRYMVHGHLGSFIKHGDDPQEADLKLGKLPTAPHWGVEPEHMAGLLHTTVSGTAVKESYPSLPGNFGLYYERLLKTLLTGAPLHEKPEHGYNVVRIIELARQSHAEKRTIACTNLLSVPYL
ncbi:MAG: oxidoreductase [Bacteroidetes bacterium]|nr:MAG: oxidoreductase [Bacteroidota bacterium]